MYGGLAVSGTHWPHNCDVLREATSRHIDLTRVPQAELSPDHSLLHPAQNTFFDSLKSFFSHRAASPSG